MNWDDEALLWRHPADASERLYFREVTGHLPTFGDDDRYGIGRWWYFELHLRNQLYDWWGPAALATVFEPVTGRPACLSGWVLDAARSNGYAILRAVEAVGERWPDLYWTRAFKSWGFHAKLVKLGIARYENGIYSFVPKSERKK